MTAELEDARKLAHGTYDDVIVAEHRRPTGKISTLHVVLEMPERSRVIDKGARFEIDGVVGDQPPTVGGSYRLIVAPATDGASPDGTLRYETMNR